MKAIIIEDEESGRITLQNMINEFCQGVEILGMAESVKIGVELIREHEPDLIFLDIELPEQNGFKIFDYFPEPDFEVVFTTAYDEYALKALKMSAVDYLLKPIDLQDLRTALEKVEEKRNFIYSNKRFPILKGNFDRAFRKLALPTNEGYYFVELNDIHRCEAQGNYTMFFLINNEKVLISRTLKIYSDLLEDHHFFRISRSQLINLNHIKKFGRQKSPTITMSDGTVVSVSPARKEELLKRIEGMI